MISNIPNALAHSAPWLFAIVMKGTILLLVTTAVAQLLRHRSAALRHFLHAAVMASLLLLPLAALLLPSLQLAVLPATTGTVQSSPAAMLQMNAPRARSMPKSANVGGVIAPSPEVTISRSAATEEPVTSAQRASESSSPLAQGMSHLSALNWSGALIAAWIFGSTLFLLRMIWLSLRLHALVRRSVPVDAITLGSRLRWLCRDLGIHREVVLLASHELDVPIAAGIFSPKIILSPQSGEWSETRRRAVLCHELAHVKRLDAFTQLIAGVASALYWFHPLVWITARAMRADRERACDDYVLAFGTPASDYAHELVEIVSTLRRPQPAAALAMARRSQLEGRVLALLNPRVRHGTLPRGIAAVVSLALFAFALPLAAARLQERPAPTAPVSRTSSPASAPEATKPAIVGSSRQEPAPPAAEPSSPSEPALAPAEPHEPISGAGSSVSFEYHNNSDHQDSTSNPAPFDCFGGKNAQHTNISSHTEDDGRRNWSASWSGGPCTIDARAGGIVRFNAEVTAIESISPGGYFEVNERIGDTWRRLRIDPAANGQLAFVYKINGTQQEFDSAARTWFGNFLQELERVTGFAASTRVPALLTKGGPQAVLTEISNLKADYVRQVYFKTLFENATLPAPLLVKALDQARNEISTDYSLAQVLLTIAEKYDLNEEAQRVAFLNGASKLRTDYEHSRVLIQLLKRPKLSPQLVRATLESAKTIHTDYEKSRILTTLAGLSSFDESEISTYLDLASSIGTDYEHSRSLMALMEHNKLTPAAVTQILKSASSIGTDYEKSRVLLALNASNSFDEKQIGTYLTLVDSIGTDYERSRDMLALMQQHKLGTESVARIIAETQKMGTDYEKARVLTEAAKRYELQGSVREAYIKAANSIGTEYERNRTLAAVTKREII
jgi:beta-lactamase regulating signal transducer with metallopeptidase domain